MLYWLQVLRGISAILVLGFHYRGFLNNVYAQKDLGDLLFSNGYMGVDVFFLISGFIIVYSTDRPEDARPLSFAIRRFFRIVPLAWIATLAFDWSEGWRFDTGLLIKSLLFVPAKLETPPWYGYSLLGVVWSLSYELIFYAIFTLVLCFTRKYRTWGASALIGLLVMSYQYISIGHLTANAHGAPVPQFTLAFFPGQIWGLMTNPILYEFVIGMVAAEIYLKYEKSNLTPNLFWTRWAAFGLFSIWLYYFIAVTPGGHGLTGKGLGAVFLFAACLTLQATYKGQVAKNAGMWFMLGTICYSLYLIHNGVTERVFWKTPFLKGTYFANPGFPQFLACTALSLVLAMVTYHLIERPVHLLGKRLARGLGPNGKSLQK
jgi:exopolysaccharide production protein ExoZ